MKQLQEQLDLETKNFMNEKEGLQIKLEEAEKSTEQFQAKLLGMEKTL
jgi:hypothetical protein